MPGLHRARALSLVVMTLLLPLDGHCATPAAFLSEAAGEVVVSPVNGASQRGTLGLPLASGDTVQVARGKAVVVYLSGRTVEVVPAARHVIGAEHAQASALMARIGATLGEMAAPGEGDAAPAVHGMARDMAIGNLRPANSRVLGPEFELTWDAAGEATAYEVTVAAQGQAAHTAAVAEASITASQLGMRPGSRYTWQVKAEGGLIARTSAEVWLEVAADSVRAAVQGDLDEVAKLHSGAGRLIMQAAVLHGRAFHAEAEALLVEASGLPGVAYPARPRLEAVRRSMDSPGRP